MANEQADKLIIVESPAKAKTLGKILPKNFIILASYGHVRDLVPKEGAVRPDADFAATYQLIEKNVKHVLAICTALKKVKALYLATDPDREGEAISWHLLEAIKERKALKNQDVHRIVFHEITESAINKAIAEPRDLSKELIEAQQARRILDYLVGFTLSPLLWKKIRRGLSAGRVQSSALRLIVEREIEIEKFKPKEYWSITAQLIKDSQNFTAKLTYFNDDKIEQFSIVNENQATDAKTKLLAAANGYLIVDKIKKSQRKRNPAAPFTTSTLQQESVRKLNFSASKTMRVAQQLYEGIDIGNGLQGLITYMRTDSVNIANEAIESLRQLILDKYGSAALPKEPRKFKTKTKNAQEAHEAIRPTSFDINPDAVKASLTVDQYKLYKLIYQRTVACQMQHAVIDQVSADLKCGEQGYFRANGSVIASPGFLKVYEEGVDDKKSEDSEKLLPALIMGEKLTLNDLLTQQHFTEPPPRFSEASLVKTLEEYGIGRPSTYASIIATLQQREYVSMDAKRFIPTDVGRVVNKFLTSYFAQYVDYDFTANLEDSLDAVSRGEKSWLPVLKEFWEPFITLIEHTATNVSRQEVTQEALDEKCPKCGKPLSVRLGRRGKFIGCTGYPECDYTRNVNDDDSSSVEPEIIADRKCPQCSSDLIIRSGRYGKFIGCSGYPKCKFIESLDKPVETNITCPSCGKGNMSRRKSRYGTYFYSCNKYPDCRYAVKNEPISKSCPDCNWPILTVKTTKRKGTELVCPQKDCDFSQDQQTS